MFGKRKKTPLEHARVRAADVLQGTLQNAKNAAHEVLDHAPEKLDDVKSAAGTALGSAGETLHGAGETLQETLHEAASRVANAAQSAATVLGAHAHALRGKAESLRGTAMDSGSDALQSTLEGASTLRGQVDETLEHAKDSALSAKDNALKSARKMKKQREKQARQAAEIARRGLEKKKAELPKVELPAPPAVSFENNGEKWLWLLVGVVVGAALGILLAPNAGRRTRAALKDKISGGKGAAADLSESLARRAQNLSHRGAGAIHDLSAGHSGQGADENADDVTIADRVRTELGRLEKEHGLERLNVDSCDGVVTLRGPVRESAVAEELVAAARGVLGVREVKNELASEGEGASFVG